MCIKCGNTATQVTHRDVSIKCLMQVQETKDYLRRNGEEVLEVEWFIEYENGTKFYVGYVTFGYYDEDSLETDFIQVLTPAI